MPVEGVLGALWRPQFLFGQRRGDREPPTMGSMRFAVIPPALVALLDRFDLDARLPDDPLMG